MTPQNSKTARAPIAHRVFGLDTERSLTTYQKNKLRIKEALKIENQLAASSKIN